MKAICNIILTSLMVLSLNILLGGCATSNPDESQMPWSQPAEWEAQGPGMPGGVR